jgi:type IV pilus assembly protein PilA
MMSHKLKNNRGFTLVELLVVIVILGIIALMAFPLLRNIINKTDNTKFTTYRDTLIDSAKIYVGDYDNDLFGNKDSGCGYVTFNDLKSKNLISDIDDSSYTCDKSGTFVKVVKVKGKYYYSAYLECSSSSNGKVILPYSEEAYKMDTTTCSKDSSTFISITGSPNSSTGYGAKRRSVTVKISSITGINSSPIIYYAWSSSNTSVSGLTFDKKVSITVPGSSKQEKKMLAAEEVVASSNEITSPSGLTGDYYLILKVDRLVDLSGNSWVSYSDLGNYVVLGPYRVDNTAPVFNSSSTIESSKTGYNYKIPKLKLSVSDNYSSSNSDFKMCVSYTNYCTDWVDYNPTKVLTEIPNFKYNGSNYSVYVSIKDKAGNIAKKTFTYTSYVKCTEKVADGEWSGSCPSCGVASVTQTRKMKDKYLDDTSCGDDTKTLSCDHPNCCSETVLSCSSWGAYSECSRACATGTKKRTRTCKYVSKYDSSKVCSTTVSSDDTESYETCNVIPCTPYIKSATDGVTYTCNNTDVYYAGNRTCNLVWSSSGDSSFSISTYKSSASAVGVFYKELFNSTTNTYLCSYGLSADCSAGLNNGYVKYQYVESSSGLSSGTLTVNVSK